MVSFKSNFTFPNSIEEPSLRLWKYVLGGVSCHCLIMFCTDDYGNSFFKVQEQCMTSWIKVVYSAITNHQEFCTQLQFF